MLSALYANDASRFRYVELHEGLNVVIAEIRLPENRKKDTHNLGKSTFGRLIDFCMLSKRDKELFLFRHYDLFRDFTFFLEVQMEYGQFLTIRRSVSEPSKIYFKRHEVAKQNFADLPDEQWDHVNLPFERARDLLDGLLNWRALKPYDYRRGLGYVLRSQDDFRDVFHLGKFAGRHADWKPFLAHILGFTSSLVETQYRREEDLQAKRVTLEATSRELLEAAGDGSTIDGLLLLKRQEVERKQVVLDNFDFGLEDRLKTEDLVQSLDEVIATLNERRYEIRKNISKIRESIKDGQIKFDVNVAEKLFQEAGVLFEGQIKRDFSQLIAFNYAITSERQAYLSEELYQYEDELVQVNTNIQRYIRRREEVLAFLKEEDIFRKYRALSAELVTLKADVESLERQQAASRKLMSLRSEVRNLGELRDHAQTEVENDVQTQSSDPLSRFSQIRLRFSEIVEEVLSRKALLSVSINKQGHLEFRAEILDEAGNTTSADLGHTYRKLLCVAFDLSVIRSYCGDKFPKFVFHDGVFETLDDRKKENLLTVLRYYTSFGVQILITAIDSDIPGGIGEADNFFEDREVALILHDEGPEGRLFIMDPW